MRLILEGEQRLHLQVDGAGLDVQSVEPGLSFPPPHAGGLACHLHGGRADRVGAARTAAVGGSLDQVEWEYVEDPYRVGRYDMTLRWPGLPPGRESAALRVAQHCTVEHTLQYPPTIDLRVVT